MPEGKCVGSARMLPLLSRSICQQSSMTTYRYPASFMPEVTMASAIWRIRSSLTLQANLFQLFHPIGGVLASVLAAAWMESVDIAIERSEEHTSELQSLR